MEPSYRQSKFVPALATFFGRMRACTPMGLVRCAFPSTRHNDPFIDAYVFLAPIIPLALLMVPHSWLTRWAAFLLGTWRLFEIMVFLANSYLFDDYRARMHGHKPRPFGGIRRVLILTAVNYIEVVLWFAAFYRLVIPDLAAPDVERLVQALNFSFVVMSAFGSSSVEVPAWWITLLTLLQSTIGLVLALAVIARSVSLLPRRGSGDPFEQDDEEQCHSA